MSRPTIREYFDIADRVYVDGGYMDEGSHNFMDIFPIENVAGMCLFCENTSDQDAVLSIEESDDGTTWSVVLFSTHTLAGQINYTCVAKSRVAMLFTSTSKYVRVTAVDANGDRVVFGVYCAAVQYPPDGDRPSAY